MAHFRTFLFDLDGTLIDHFAAIHRSHVHTLQQFGLPPPTMTEVRRAIGRGLEHAVAKLIGPENAHLIPETLPVYRSYWAKTMLDDVTLLPGARELLTRLKRHGWQNAVFTNKQGASARTVCTHFQLDPLLDGIYGAFDTPWLKPDREFSEYVLTQLGAEAPTTLFVGDSPYDIAAARNAGFACWCVTTGTHTADELRAEHADAVFDDLIELTAHLFASQTA